MSNYGLHHIIWDEADVPQATHSGTKTQIDGQKSKNKVSMSGICSGGLGIVIVQESADNDTEASGLRRKDIFAFMQNNLNRDAASA
ncbi:hypothetical protein QE152_g27527 [Popillia japonica]|uniref:Uncharacterized protein n=1 Tax=Popillia japonica TaxID=7064 RepID=A0AAW1JV71_POPJA